MGKVCAQRDSSKNSQKLNAGSIKELSPDLLQYRNPTWGVDASCAYDLGSYNGYPLLGAQDTPSSVARVCAAGREWFRSKHLCACKRLPWAHAFCWV